MWWVIFAGLFAFWGYDDWFGVGEGWSEDCCARGALRMGAYGMMGLDEGKSKPVGDGSTASRGVVRTFTRLIRRRNCDTAAAMRLTRATNIGRDAVFHRFNSGLNLTAKLVIECHGDLVSVVTSFGPI